MFEKVEMPVLGIVENMSGAHLLELRPRGAHLRRAAAPAWPSSTA
jgi:Mrp family chromosome partitioning ATPase